MDLRSERAIAISSGQLDEEMPDYDELVAWLPRVSLTWLPALLAETAKECERRHVFREGRMMPFIERAMAMEAIRAATESETQE